MPVMLGLASVLSFQRSRSSRQNYNHYKALSPPLPIGKGNNGPTSTTGGWRSGPHPTFRNSQDLSDHQSQHFLPGRSTDPCPWGPFISTLKLILLPNIQHMRKWHLYSPTCSSYKLAITLPLSYPHASIPPITHASPFSCPNISKLVYFSPSPRLPP